MMFSRRLRSHRLLLLTPMLFTSCLIILPFIDAFATTSSSRSIVQSYRFHVPKLSLLRGAEEEFNDDVGNSNVQDGSMSNREKLQSFFPFPLDKWQLDAGEVLCDGCSCIVCAPTGSGKTVVGEMALQLAFEKGKNSIYTTPLKALSNQKFFELRKIFGAENVGLATGDTSINRGARITVMTTEVYRNMAWRSASSSVMPVNPTNNDNDFVYDDLSENLMVVLDEFHYMGQPGRGGVWEECVITSPHHTQIVGLSATLPNASNLAGWMQSVTNRRTVLIEAGGSRPVPLRYLYASSDGIMPLFQDPDAGPGSPKGLLGFRGDGVVEKPVKTKKKGGFGDKSSDENNIVNGIPRGLRINLSIREAIEKRVAKVDRIAKRRTLEREQSRENSDDSWEGDNSYKPRRGRSSTTKEERRDKERLLKNEMRRTVPTLSYLVRRLDDKSLLPAIVFIFSRAGCENAAQSISNQLMGPVVKQLKSIPQSGGKKRNESSRNDKVITDAKGRSFRVGNKKRIESKDSDLGEDVSSDEVIDNILKNGSIFHEYNLQLYATHGLLDYESVQDVALRICSFNDDNQEIPISDEVAIRFMLGIGAHHAGMLPAHKSLVEVFFRSQLLKLIFATETLAAGINMPARTTVIMSMAKRGDGGSIGLLRTSNLLQIAGRAGRRGMDVAGTCVLVATPFEGADEAATILLNEIEPVTSQFSPSYSLAVNLIARGNGELDVAKALVEKSFAVWEKRQEEDNIVKTLAENVDGNDTNARALAAYNFFNIIENELKSELNRYKSSMDQTQSKDTAKSLEEVLITITNEQLLKKASKSYVAEKRMLDLEEKTIAYLMTEAEEAKEFGGDFADLFGSEIDEQGIETDLYRNEQIDEQEKRIQQSKIVLENHVFSLLSMVLNNMMSQRDLASSAINDALARARGEVSDRLLDADELVSFVKSFSSKRLKKIIKRVRKEESLLFDDDGDSNDSWSDMQSMISVLESFGAIYREENESSSNLKYMISNAGENVSELNFENSLWAMTALGGAWDVAGESRRIDSLNDAFDDLFDFENTDNEEKLIRSQKPQEEANELVQRLLGLLPSEMAGYVSCLVAEDSRKVDTSVMDLFERLSDPQRRVIESASLAAERLIEVQRKYSVDDAGSMCRLELGSCAVVTSWASGCTWQEALDESGLAPGDLVRVLQRALDALRQLGNLPYYPVRNMDGNFSKGCPGIHPDLRKTCRDAATQMDRYPIKDILSFDDEVIDIGNEGAVEGDDVEISDITK